MSSFGILLKTYRQEIGLTQKQLATMCSFSRDYIAHLEIGEKTAPPMESVFVIAKALSLSPEKRQKFLESAQSERLYYVFGEHGKPRIESFVSYAANNFSKEEIHTLTHQLQKLAISK